MNGIPVKAGGPGFATGMGGVEEIDASSLERDLAAAVEGEVRFDTGEPRLLRHRRVELPAAADRRGDPGDDRRRGRDARGVPPPPARRSCARGCGTSLSGRDRQPRGGHRLLEAPGRHRRDRSGHRRAVGSNPAPSTRGDRYAGEAGLVFAPDPSTHEYCTIGGNIGNNSCGIHSLQARIRRDRVSRTSDNVSRARGAHVRRPPDARRRHERGRARTHRRRRAGGAGRSTRDLRDLRDRYADR